MEKLLERYNIPQELTLDEKLALLEKEKQKLLRKLNHVFGNPEKEAELNREMELLESGMESLKHAGGTLSFDDVTIETRSLSQTAVDTKTAKRIRIQETEQRIIEQDPAVFEIVYELYEIIFYYLQQKDFGKYEFWLNYGAQKGISDCMGNLYNLYTNEVYDYINPKKAFYWMKKGAENGDKTCCEAYGDYFADADNEVFSPKQAVAWYVKAADEEHPAAYLKAFWIFYYLQDYKRAEICLNAAENMGIENTRECRVELEKAKRG